MKRYYNHTERMLMVDIIDALCDLRIISWDDSCSAIWDCEWVNL